MKFFPSKSLELTVALIKPHAAKVPSVVENIKCDILNNRFFIVKHELTVLNLELASKMYAVHKSKSFYPRLVGHMTSGPIISFLLARENGIKHWRAMMGMTRSYEAHVCDPMSLRGLYGLSNTRNVTHGSDSLQSAKEECSIFFPEFNFTKWYDHEEIYFRNGYVQFIDDLFIHVKQTNDIPKLLLTVQT
ncbi:hypothetical protein O3M35_009083 [Rhynocoris fuscipes]|uniref:Nucleoside diphosphate kinase n=1 Tax=Rhynocoris fuscipes TaxID=488301 RepID=A0AAW1D2H5_9HEMI